MARRGKKALVIKGAGAHMKHTAKKGGKKADRKRVRRK